MEAMMDANDLARDAKATLTIILKLDGQVGVVGPVANKLLCYGMLEMAKSAIAAFVEPSAILQPKIIPPNDAGRPRG
jgi:hypothetical protein